MSRYGFDDILAGRGLLGSLYSPDMEGVVPLQGLLAGFDYRAPYQNETAPPPPSPPRFPLRMPPKPGARYDDL